MTDGLARPATVAVFGGHSEIARALVARLVAGGARHVALAVRDEQRPVAVDAPKVDVVGFDADAPEGHEATVAAVADRLGDIDLAVVAFGVLGDQATAERDPAAAVALARTNFVGGVSVLVAVAERMRAQGHGAIVVLSSVAAERPRRSNFAYGATKAGLDAFAQGLGEALAPDGVHVLVVRPGFVRTKMTAGLRPAPLATDAQAVAKVIEQGLRRRARMVWAPPALRWLFVILRHLPGPLFRRLEQ